MKRTLEATDLLYVNERQDWRDWLAAHYNTAPEIWLVSYKKHTGRPSLLYNDAVEEALCFGWIDSTRRSLDGDCYAQRFSPRKPKSSYSQANKERLRELVAQGQVIDEVLSTLGGILDEPFVVPSDILSAIQSDPAAWENFQRFSAPYVRIRVAFIDGARDRPAEFEKRLRYFIEMSARNKQFGYGGIEKYY